MLSFSISYPDLIKFPYFADLTQRGDDKGVKGGTKTSRVTLRKTLTDPFLFTFFFGFE